MSSAAGSIEIARGADDVFRYSADPKRRSEWQESVKEITVETPRPTGVGTRVREVRRVPGGPRAFRWEFSAYEPATRWTFRGIDGPVRTRATMTFLPLAEGNRTRVTFEIDFDGRGIGRLFAALARRSAPTEIRSDLANLKRRLEADGSTSPAS